MLFSNFTSVLSHASETILLGVIVDVTRFRTGGRICKRQLLAAWLRLRSWRRDRLHLPPEEEK